MPHTTPTIIATGKFLSLAKRDGWEYVTRSNSTGVVGVVPITDDNRILLIEQHRPPVNATVIEIPAGLVGDDAGHAAEPAESAARRELLEETGYDAATLTLLTHGPTSPGLCDELMSIYLAQELRRVGPALGDGHEQITLHPIALANVHEWLDNAARAGKFIDHKVFTGLHLAARHVPRVRQAIFGR